MKRIISKICNFFKKYKEYFLSFLFGFILILIIFLIQGFYFRDKSMLLSDSFGQYYELFYYLKEVFNGTRSIFYTFQIGGGTGMIATLAYYLISPFNILIAFFDFSHLQLAMHLIIMLKIALSFTTMFILLRSEHKKTNYWVLLAFASCYALSDYAIGYEFDFIWFDALYLLPLIVLGINKIVDKKKPILYFVTLFLAIMCNYYMGYMLCIFSVLYFIYRLFIKYNAKKEEKEMLKVTSTYVITTLCAGLSTFFIMYPTLQAMKEINRSSISNATTIGFFGIEMISKLFFGVQDSAVLNKDNAFLYCGLINIVMPIMYFFNKKINKKEQIWSLALMLFLILSLFFKPLYYMWHVFSTPSSFAARFSYIIIFFSILLSVKEFDNIKTSELKEYLISIIFVCVLSLYFIINSIDYLNYGSIYGTVIGCFFYLFLLYEYKNYDDQRSQIALRKMIIFLMIGELFFNSYILLNSFNKNSYLQIDEYDNILNDAYNQIEDNSFYRIADENDTSMVAGFFTNNNLVSIFSSTTSSHILQFVQNQGYNYYANAFKYRDNSTQVTDMLLNAKYISSDQYNYKNYIKIGEYKYSTATGLFYNLGLNTFDIYKNPNTFGIATMVSSQKLNSNYTNTMDYQNLIFQTLVGTDENVYTNIDTQITSDGEYSFIAPDAKYIYFDLPRLSFKDGDKLNVYFNDILVAERKDNSEYEDEIMKIALNCNSGDKVRIRIKLNGSNSLQKGYVYILNEKVFSDGVQELKNRAMTNVEWKNDGYVKGTVTATDDFGMLYVSIPYEKGWTAYVDGVKTDIIELYSGMMGVALATGEHTVELKYQTPGLLIGFMIALLSFIGYLFYYHYKNIVDDKVSGFIIKFSRQIIKFLHSVLDIIISIFVFTIFTTILSWPSLSAVTMAWLFMIAYKYILTNKKKYKDCDSFMKDLFIMCKNDAIILIIETIIMYYLVYYCNLDYLVTYILTLIFSNVAFNSLKRIVIVDN